MVLDHFKVLVLSGNPHLKHPFKLLGACFRHLEESRILGTHLSIIIRFLPDIIDHTFCWRWGDTIQTMIVAATTHRHLGTQWAVGLLATMNDAKTHYSVRFHCPLYPSGSSMVIEDWCRIMRLHRVSNSSGPPLWLRVQVRTEPSPKKRSGWSIHLNCQFGYGSMDISQPIRIGQVVSVLSSGSICRFVYCSWFCCLIIVFD